LPKRGFEIVHKSEIFVK